MSLIAGAVAVEDGWRSQLIEPGDDGRVVWTADWSEPLEDDALSEARLERELRTLGLVPA